MLPLTRNTNDLTTDVRRCRAGWTLVAHGTSWYIAINVLGGMLPEGARQLARANARYWPKTDVNPAVAKVRNQLEAAFTRLMSVLQRLLSVARCA